MKKKLYFVLIAILLFSITGLAGESPFVRFPAIDSKGETISFSFQGDIWTVPVSGGKAFRVTIHSGYDFAPVFGPFGKSIAFSSNRYGNNDVFIVSLNGGIPKRLTYHSTGDLVTDWHKNGGIVLESRRNGRHVERELEIFSSTPSGGTPVHLFPGLGARAVLSDDGNLVAFEKGTCRVARESYKGPANRDIWIYNISKKRYVKITDFKGQDFHPAWSGNDLFFISAVSGRYNIYRIKTNPDGTPSGKPVQITNFRDESVTWLSAADNGKTLVFEKGTNIYTSSFNGDNIRRVNIDIATDLRFDPVERKSFTSRASDISVSPDGKYIAFSVHGEIFVKKSSEKKSRAVNVSNHYSRDKDPVWLDKRSVLFSSDRDGKFDLFLVTVPNKDKTDLYSSLRRTVKKITDDPNEETNPVISPDGKKILFLRGNGILVSADIDSNGNISGEKKLLDGWAQPSGISFSPDGKWVAYALDDLNFNSEVYIQPVDNSRKPVNVSMHPRGDYSPVWSQDGSKLGFLSMRNNSSIDVWFAWLKKSDWEKTSRDWEEESDSASKKKGKTGSKKTEKVKVRVDLEGIYKRLVQVTRLAGNESGFTISKDGKTFVFSGESPGAKGKVLFSINWDGKKLTKFSGPGNNPRRFVNDPSGKVIYLISGRGSLAKADLKSRKIKPLPFNARMKIHYNLELDQIFEEAWRMLRDNFYDPEFHGRDWKQLKKIYKAKCMKASTRQDFRDMFNQMLGQLNASHMGMYGSGREVTQKEFTGLLGVRIKPVDRGIEVADVIPGSPADKSVSKLYPGDTILTVSGEKITKNSNFWSLLTDTAGQKILLTVKNRNGKVRDVVIRPVSSLRSLLYDEWVEQRRKLTEKYSNGKLGYLHIQGMNMRSFERFERELSSAGHGKDGIVIDVRYNGGGWTTDYLMAVLNVKQHAYTIPRGAVKTLKDHLRFKDNYPFAERLPFYAWNKPSIALCNASSYSNAEIFSHAYKTLGIGTLVGEPTFGAVISTGGLGLINGMYVRKPFRAWFVKATKKNMEWGPAVPDEIIVTAPDEKAKGVDSQLKKACEILLDQMK